MDCIQVIIAKIKNLFGMHTTIEKNSICTDTYNDYICTTDGMDTSIQPPRRVKNDRRLSKYKVIEEHNAAKRESKQTMKHYLVGDDSHFPVPGLVCTNILGKCCTTMVPQGICKMDNYILITAYDSEGNNNSVIYVLEDGTRLKATLVYNRGCHMGGIAYDGKYIWIAEGSKSGLGAVSKEDFLDAIRVSEEMQAKSVLLKNILWQKVSEITSTSYCTYYDNRLWVGKFAKNEESHIYGYSIDYSRENPKIIPDRYIAAPKRAQGMCFYKNGKAVYLGVSTSYGRYSNSVLRCYKLDDYYEPVKRDNIFVIGKGEAYKTITMPPMLEQVSIDGEMLYCIFESGARKYLMNMDGYGYSRRPIGSCIVFDGKKIFHTN